MAITAVGTLKSAAANGTTTLAVSPVNRGDCWLMAVFYNSSTVSTTGVTGGGVAAGGWSRVAPRTLNSHGDGEFEIWLGEATTTGSSTITVAFSGSVAAVFVELAAQEFNSGLGENVSWTGSQTTWALDKTGFRNNASSTVIAFPTLVPAGAGELYFGYMLTTTGVSAGATSGYTYALDSNGNQCCWNPNISASTSPTSSQSPAGISAGTAVLVTAAIARRRQVNATRMMKAGCVS